MGSTKQNERIAKMKPQDKINEIKNWEDLNTFKTTDLICEKFNVPIADIDDAGDVWVAQSDYDNGRWLTDAELVDFITWIENR
jgi:hypothetical protein